MITASQLLAQVSVSGAKEAESQLIGVGRASEGAGSMLKSLAIGGLAIAGTALVAVGVASLKSAADFETAMRSNVAHAGLAKSQFDSVSQSVLAMASSVGRSPTQLAEALYPILSAFSGIQNQAAKSAIALDTLKDSFQAVAGTTTDGTAVANAAVGTFNALGLATNNVSENTARMTNLFDIMDKTTQLGNMQWETYKNVVSKVAIAIQGTGISFNESQAALAELTNEGFSAQKASTYLANTFATLEIKTDSLAKHAKSVGVAFDEQKFKSMDLAGQIEYLNQVTDGNKSKLLALMGNNRTALQTFDALSIGVSGYKSNLDALNHAQGALAASFDEASKGFNFHIEQLKAAGEAVLISIGTKLLPVASKVIGVITPLVSAFGDWIGKSNGLGSALDSLKPIGDAIESTFNGIVDAVKSPEFAQLAATLQSVFTPALQAAGDVINSTFKPAMDALSGTQASSISVSLRQAALAVNIFVEALQGFKDGSSQFAIAGTQIRDTAFQAWNVILQVGDYLSSTFTPVWQQLQTTIQSQVIPAWNDLVNSLKPLMPTFAALGEAVGVVIVAALWLFTQVLAKALSVVIQVFGGIVQIISGAVQAIGGSIAFLVDLFSGNFAKLGDDLRAQWNGIIDIFRGALNILNGITGGALNALLNIFGTSIDKINAQASNMNKNTSKSASDMSKNVQGSFSDMSSNGMGSVQVLSDTATRLFQQMNKNATGQMASLDQSTISYWNDIAAYIDAKSNQAAQDANENLGKIHVNGGTYGNVNNIGNRNANDSSNVPGHASGTNFAPGGLSWVGERGPELMYVPKGAQIIPNQQSMAMTSGNNQPVQHIHIEVGGHEVLSYLIDQMGNAMMQQSILQYGGRRW